MPVDTRTDIEQVLNVQAEDGSRKAAANQVLQEAIRDRLGNWGALEAIEHTTGGTAAEQLPAHAVPAGVTVTVVYLEANAGTVYVGDESAQPAALTAVGQGFQAAVADTSAIYVRTPNAGDGVGVLWEATP